MTEVRSTMPDTIYRDKITPSHLRIANGTNVVSSIYVTATRSLEEININTTKFNSLYACTGKYKTF